MAAGATYTPIATTTLGSAAGTVTLSSIPSTYTDLVLVFSPYGTSAGGSNVYLQFNNDTATNYSRTWMEGDGTSASSSRNSNTDLIYLNYSTILKSTEPTTFIVNINNYSNTTTYKTVLGRQSTASVASYAVVGLWRSTSAINSIKLTGTNFASGSVFSLYGITAA